MSIDNDKIITEVDSIKKDLISGYSIKGLVGRGAMGNVYKAMDIHKGVPVAIKILFPYFSRKRDFILRFNREAKTISKLDHPNIVKGYTFGKIHNLYYFVMEYIEGSNLETFLREKRILDAEEAVTIILQVAYALSFANKERIIHRDVKPSNIILTPNGIAKLTDFGLARDEIGKTITSIGTILGTPCYSSPEQARGDMDIDIRSDIYSLGITLFRMVTGDVPFSDLDTSLILTKKITDQIPSPIDYNKHISKALDFIIRKMAACERKDRYKSPDELIRDLNLYQKGKFIVPSLDAKKEHHIKENVKIDIENEAPFANSTVKQLLENTDLNLKQKTLSENEVLFYEGDETDEIYVLLSGKLEVLKSGRHIIYMTQSGEFVGEMSSILNIPRSATVRAIIPSSILEIQSSKFHEFIKAAPDLSFKLIHSLAFRLNVTTNQLKDSRVKLATIKDNMDSINECFEIE